MAFTDPPYNVSLGDHGGHRRGQPWRRIQNDSMPAAGWESFCRRWSRNLLASVDGAIYDCMSTKEWPLVSRVLEEEGAHRSDTLIWAKDRFVLGRADYQRQYEPIWYCRRICSIPRGRRSAHGPSPRGRRLCRQTKRQAKRRRSPNL
jgi:DNA modification methylase